MNKYSKICLLTGLSLIMSFFLFCIASAHIQKDNQCNNNNNIHIQKQQEKIKRKLNIIEKRMIKRKERLNNKLKRLQEID